MVEDVECFPSKLEIAAFAGSQLDVLEQRHIPVLHASSAEDVTSASLRRSDCRENYVLTLIEGQVERDRPILVGASNASGGEPKAVVEVDRRSGHELRHPTQLVIVGEVREPLGA